MGELSVNFPAGVLLFGVREESFPFGCSNGGAVFSVVGGFSSTPAPELFEVTVEEVDDPRERKVSGASAGFAVSLNTSGTLNFLAEPEQAPRDDAGFFTDPAEYKDDAVGLADDAVGFFAHGGGVDASCAPFAPFPRVEMLLLPPKSAILSRTLILVCSTCVKLHRQPQP